MCDEKKAEIISVMPRMITLKDATEVSPFSYYALRKMCLEGRVACVRNSGKIYINLQSLIDLMNGGDVNEKQNQL